ncbi:MFS transporter [Brevibacterium sp. BRM-1]|uniref:MFS transporter n=1 Tax=Brevibacterium sp. BRM-1 TaxID=2999062 RepID=UPI002281D1F4|nr:MFS transporter [Brevibacterium sp. BRM-1]WAL40659.1 MFS transporter [Brevibacterium sp. BRM-1]
MFALSSAACAAAPTMGLLLLFRCLQGAGTALMLPQTLAVLTAEFEEPAQRARVVGLWAGVSSLGLAAGPVLGGLITSIANWRWGFGLSALLGLAALVMGGRAITAEHGRPADPPSLDVVGAALGALGLGALVEGLLALPAHGLGAPRVVGAFVIAAVALPGFLAWQFARQRAGRSALMPPRLWRSRALSAANISGAAYFFLFFGTMYFYSVDLQDARGHSALSTGLMFLPMMALTAFMGPVAGRITASLGAGRVMLTGLAIGVLGSVLLALLPAHYSVWDFEWRMAVVGIAAGLMSSPMSNLAVSGVPTAEASTAAAVHNTFRQIGSTMGVAVLGVITAHATAAAGSSGRGAGLPGLDTAMLTTAGVLGAALLAAGALLFGRRGAGRGA